MALNRRWGDLVSDPKKPEIVDSIFFWLHFPVAEPGFPRPGGRPTSKVRVPTYYLCKIFPANCMKIKFGPGGEGEGASPPPTVFIGRNRGKNTTSVLTSTVEFQKRMDECLPNSHCIPVSVLKFSTLSFYQGKNNLEIVMSFM